MMSGSPLVAELPLLPAEPAEDVNDALRRQERSSIVLAFWAIALLGLPFWWATTSIERHPLPTSEVAALLELQPCPLEMPIPLDLALPSKQVDIIRQQLQERAAASEVWQCLRFASSTQGSSMLSYGSTAEAVESLSERYMPHMAGGGPDIDARVAKFSSRYKLVFSLLFEDAAASASTPGWAVEDVLERYVLPISNALAPLHQFSIETQIQSFAPLQIQPVFVGEMAVLEEDQLKAFINSAEWNLASTASLDPALHFLLYIPSASSLRIRQASGELSSTNAFITPQWGGVVILNLPSSDAHLSAAVLDAPFSLFAHQLSTLLGVQTSSGSAPSRQQVEAVLRRTTLANARETVDTLAAITKLASEIRNMRVAKSVGRGVAASIAELKQAQYAAEIGDFDATSRFAAKAHEHAERAFFDPDMLALLYFPAEHVYAIYTPLFGPIAVPLLVALLREVRGRRERRRTVKLKVQ